MIVDAKWDCGYPWCGQFIDWWITYWHRHEQPVAILNCWGYWASISRNSRHKIKQAQKRYEYRPFAFQDYVDDVAAVNFSMAIRSGRPMRGWYLTPADDLRGWFLDGRPIEGGLLPHEHPCPYHQEIWYGGFDAEGKLACYCNMGRLNNLGCLLYILRHGDARVGALNGLFAYLAENANVDYLTYHVMKTEDGGETRETFKRSIGFTEQTLEFV